MTGTGEIHVETPEALAMRTLVIIVAGLLLLAVFAFAGVRWGGMQSIATAGKIFIAVWLAVALVNMGFGVLRAGYSINEELPVFLVLFGVPAAVAAVFWWKYG